MFVDGVRPNFHRLSKLAALGCLVIHANVSIDVQTLEAVEVRIVRSHRGLFALVLVAVVLAVKIPSESLKDVTETVLKVSGSNGSGDEREQHSRPLDKK